MRLDKEASPATPGDGYADSSERDTEAKQNSDPSSSAAFNDTDLDPSQVDVLPGTGGPDDVGTIDAEPDDYRRDGRR